ncbi:MAG: helix-turn-helix transcriptional regulator [Alistipes sp.]|nr:helix-turn-helix transcriptional regulator [Alistipes sp.]
MDIKRVIKQRGLTVKEVAARMGIAKEGLSVHINGNPSVQVLERIADAVGCEVGDFFTSSDNDSITCPHCGKQIKIKIE